jgi:hypothetical protein
MLEVGSVLSSFLLNGDYQIVVWKQALIDLMVNEDVTQSYNIEDIK